MVYTLWESHLQDKIRTASIVIPLYNEQENIDDLIKRIEKAMVATELAWELVLVDDGSTDNTCSLLQQAQANYDWIKIISLRRNFGQTAAMAAGFDHSVGEVIIPLDGDLQNDPADIPRLIEKLNEGYDVVSGWRRHRKDNLITRLVPSWIANALIGLITGVRLHDYGCTLKAYHRSVVDYLNLYGEMHRFIPALASWSGARVAEIEVNHFPRTRGKSKYGLNRTIKVMLDLITVKFLGSFSTKPLHVFGGIGIATMLAAFASGFMAIYNKFAKNEDLSDSALPILTVMFILMSVQFLLMGLLAEMLCRTYHESQNKPTYIVRSITGTTPLSQHLSALDNIKHGETNQKTT